MVVVLWLASCTSPTAAPAPASSGDGSSASPGSSNPSEGPAPTGGSTTVPPPSRLFDVVGDDGHWTADQAVALLDATYGSGLGGAAEVLPADDPLRRSGTMAMLAVVANWPELSAAQQAAAAAVLELPAGFDPTDLAVEPSNASDTAPSASGLMAGLGSPLPPEAAAVKAALAEVSTALAAHLGPLQLRVQLLPAGGGTAEPLGDALRLGSTCRIRYYPSIGRDPATVVATMAHELFHCYQFQWNPNLGEVPAWVVEGSATWAEALIAPELGQTPDTAGHLTGYYADTTRSLATRTYDAGVVWSLIDAAGGDFWTRIQKVMVESRHGRAFDVATAGLGGDRFTAMWAAGDVDRLEWGSTWHQPWRDRLPAPDRTILEYPLVNGTSVDVSAPAYATVAHEIEMNGEVFVVIPIGTPVGRVRMPGGVESDVSEWTNQEWCTLTGDACVCPDDTPRAGTVLPEAPGGQAVWAMSGGTRSAGVTIEVRSVRDACGGTERCAVGVWRQSTPVEVPGLATVEGGDGATLTIAEDGTALLDYSTQSAWVTRPAQITDNSVLFGIDLGGAASFHVTFPGRTRGTLGMWGFDFSKVTYVGALVAGPIEESVGDTMAGFFSGAAFWMPTSCTDERLIWSFDPGQVRFDRTSAVPPRTIRPPAGSDPVDGGDGEGSAGDGSGQPSAGGDPLCSFIDDGGEAMKALGGWTLLDPVSLRRSLAQIIAVYDDAAMRAPDELVADLELFAGYMRGLDEVLAMYDYRLDQIDEQAAEWTEFQRQAEADSGELAAASERLNTWFLQRCGRRLDSEP